jgi:hypothetical protein
MHGNKKQLWALLAFLAIPVIFVAGGALLTLIDPDKLTGHTHYVRNYRLLQLARGGAMLAMFGAVVVAWFATCLLVVMSKRQPYSWLLLAFLGPIGLAILACLPDLGPEAPALYSRCVRKLNILVRGAYEIGFFMLAWTLAWEAMILEREAMISVQAVMTGVSKEQIIQDQNASSGMYAFGELNDVMYVFALLYLLRPVCVDVLGALFNRGGRAATPSPPAV